MESIAVINGEPGRNFDDDLGRALIWKTCLREIAILDAREVDRALLHSSDSLYTRQEAYQFLLEVICGLHSPLVAETEVMGQFRKFALRAAEGPGAHCTAPWMQRLLADAKRVRTKHLIGLGGQSYGQIAARALEECPTIYVLGAGQLVEETLPSLADHRVEIFCRRPEETASLVERHGNAAAHAIKDGFDGNGSSGPVGLLVAAPISAREIVEWSSRIEQKMIKVIDLRGESRTDALSLEEAEIVHFCDILENLESNRRFASERVEKAREEIRSRAASFWKRYEVRPFGWEDLCA